MVMGMGFTQDQAMKALRATDNNLERAVEWIFSHQTELDAQESEGDGEQAKELFRDDNPRKLRNHIYEILNWLGASTFVFQDTNWWVLYLIWARRQW